MRSAFLITVCLMFLGCVYEGPLPDWSGAFECEEAGPREVICYGRTTENMPIQYIFVGNESGVMPRDYVTFVEKVHERGGTITFLTQ